MLKKIVFLLVVLMLIGAGILLVRHKKAEIASIPLPERPLIPVKTVQVHFGNFECKKRLLGTIIPKVSAQVAYRVTGHIIDVRVREGRAVKKGDILSTIDNRIEKDRVLELEASLAAARTEYATREAIYQRDRALFSANAISKEALDLSHAARDNAKARVRVLTRSLETAKTNLSYTILYAPFSGMITERFKDPGDLAQPGIPILSMEDPTRGYYVSVQVPQDLFPLLRKGGKAYIIGEKEVLPCRISRIHPSVRMGTLATVEIDINRRPFGLPSGATVDVDLVTKEVKGYQVPVRAILEDVDKSYVFLFSTNENDRKTGPGIANKKGRIHVVQVDIVAKGPELAVITGDIKDGDILVTAQESGLLRLHDGQEVMMSIMQRTLTTAK